MVEKRSSDCSMDFGRSCRSGNSRGWVVFLQISRSRKLELLSGAGTRRSAGSESEFWVDVATWWVFLAGAGLLNIHRFNKLPSLVMIDFRDA